MKIKNGDKLTIVAILILLALFSSIFLGFTGFKVIFGMLLVFFLPFYLILDNFNLSGSEKIMLSFFIGVGIFPAVAYWLGVFISLKLAIIITFAILVLVGFAIRAIRKIKH